MIIYIYKILPKENFLINKNTILAYVENPIILLIFKSHFRNTIFKDNIMILQINEECNADVVMKGRCTE